jgi:hypothetical protein
LRSISFYLNGLLTEGWMFVMRPSASSRGFHRIYLNQAQQVFLDGHVRAFEHFGGVPSLRVRCDNLKPPSSGCCGDAAASRSSASSPCGPITC